MTRKDPTFQDEGMSALILYIFFRNSTILLMQTNLKYNPFYFQWICVLMPFKYRNRQVSVIAHRGGGELFKENTLSAFRSVQDMGVDAVECDVQVTKDGKLAVIHDADLRRVAGINSRVDELTGNEIQKVKLLNNETIPMLEDVFHQVSIPLVIELKSIETVKSLSSMLLQNSNLQERCVIISFYHEALYVMKQQFPRLKCGALLAGFPLDPVTMVKQCGCDTISLYFEGITRDYVDKCHVGGIYVGVWSPNEKAHILDSLNAGVDAIGSDRPDLVISSIKESEQSA